MAAPTEIPQVRRMEPLPEGPFSRALTGQLPQLQALPTTREQYNTGWQGPLGSIAYLGSKAFEGAGQRRAKEFLVEETDRSNSMRMLLTYAEQQSNNPNLTPAGRDKARQVVMQLIGEHLQGKDVATAAKQDGGGVWGVLRDIGIQMTGGPMKSQLPKKEEIASSYMEMQQALEADEYNLPMQVQKIEQGIAGIMRGFDERRQQGQIFSQQDIMGQLSQARVALTQLLGAEAANARIAAHLTRYPAGPKQAFEGAIYQAAGLPGQGAGPVPAQVAGEQRVGPPLTTSAKEEILLEQPTQPPAVRAGQPQYAQRLAEQQLFGKPDYINVISPDQTEAIGIQMKASTGEFVYAGTSTLVPPEVLAKWQEEGWGLSKTVPRKPSGSSAANLQWVGDRLMRWNASEKKMEPVLGEDGTPLTRPAEPPTSTEAREKAYDLLGKAFQAVGGNRTEMLTWLASTGNTRGYSQASIGQAQYLTRYELDLAAVVNAMFGVPGAGEARETGGPPGSSMPDRIGAVRR